MTSASTSTSMAGIGGEQTPIGLAVDLIRRFLTGGIGVPEMDALISAMGEQEFEYVAMPFTRLHIADGVGIMSTASPTMADGDGAASSLATSSPLGGEAIPI